MPAGLLGGHVAGRAHDLAGLGLPAVRLESLGEAEVGDLGRAVRGKEDVGRLEVAVDDSGVVCDLNGPGQSDQKLGGIPARLWSACEAVLQRATLEQLQGNEWFAVGLADLENLDDIGMTKASDGLGLDPDAGEMNRSGLARPHGSSSRQPGD